ncbi:MULTISPECIES: helix-hairpin-helix domain-containing protein [Geobacter]|uniref:helix-hairpin-helix domain-containing protein n=1 Tax=Geobacter TaxID=28231 RepID=UPI002572EF1C|nr:helix-hairpin-helix domain-containing protein [Geobacter sulfurreducens]BEH09485.1 helix-hairpin-helix domain-containing protein [Geobacter sulfurreducens subsp. ethanolicus]BET57368.1 helix-hairpin-helix domain-containing protein [Geobacter sp. 60473]HML78592.1 helix-hairpin-helix domain-containing protein [Geobacter sulfurreducens]
MADVQKELQKIRGIGEVLAKRLAEAGHDTFGKIAAAGEEGLRAIKGMNPRSVASIVAQAAELAEGKAEDRARRVEELKAAALTLREQVEGVARTVRERFADELEKKTARRVEKEFLKVVTTLEKVEGKIGRRVKRAGKGLAKAEKRLAGLADTGLKEVEQGLRRTRKALKRVLA